jgi:hypothetical protein
MMAMKDTVLVDCANPFALRVGSAVALSPFEVSGRSILSHYICMHAFSTSPDSLQWLDECLL